jgi:cytochrome c peroxidase
MIRPLALPLALLVCTAAWPQVATDFWWEPGLNAALFPHTEYPNPNGWLGMVNAAGTTHTLLHPFFEPIGTNGRACVSCHQPAHAMSVSAEAIRIRWNATKGKDPIFAAIDGSNCPTLPQDKESSHSLLLNRGLIRVFIPWPPKNAEPEFTIEVVRDPSTCNLDPMYGLKSATPAVSVFRRPRMTANLKYVTNPAGAIVLKTGMPADKDPETGRPVGMNMMADAREATLTTQAIGAALGHLQAKRAPSADELKLIVEFESQLYSAQVWDNAGLDLDEPGSPQGLTPENLAKGKPGVLGDNNYSPVFHLFDEWKKAPGKNQEQRAFRESVARGNEIFMFRQFWLRDATHINSIGLGNPLKRTCATCHNAQMTGQDLSAGWVDLGTNNYPTWTEKTTFDEKGELPVFKLTCRKDAPPHPYLGRVVYTTDPGRALISGKCVDIGSIVMQQFRGLAARAPYFANGSAKTLREVVDYYDRRFDMKLTEQEKQDLTNFLSVL